MSRKLRDSNLNADDDDFTLVSSPDEMPNGIVQPNIVDQTEGVMGPNVDSTDAKPVVRPIDWGHGHDSGITAGDVAAVAFWKSPTRLSCLEQILRMRWIIALHDEYFDRNIANSYFINIVQPLPLPFRVICYAAISLCGWHSWSLPSRV